MTTRTYFASPVRAAIPTVDAILDGGRPLSTNDAFFVATRNAVESALNDDRVRSGFRPLSPEDRSMCSSSVSRAFVFHLAQWHVNPDASYSLSSSRWYIYRISKRNKPEGGGDACTLVPTGTKWSTGQPLLYGDEAMVLFGISEFDVPVSVERVAISYKISVTPGVAENVSNLAQAISTVLGLTTGTKGPAPDEKRIPPLFTTYFNHYLSIGAISAIDHLPKDFNVSYAVSQNSSNPSPEGSQAFPKAFINTPYSGQVWVRDQDDGPWKFSVDGDLPKGLELNADTGAIRGMVQSDPKLDQSLPKDFKIKISVTNKFGRSATLQESVITVSPLPGKKDGGQQTDTSAAKTKSVDSGTGGVGGGTKGNGDGSQQTNSQAIDCSSISPDSGCSFTSTLRSDDREWWDVGLGLTIPGVKEAKYSSTNLTAPPSITTHTDALVLFDFYFLAPLVNKESFKSIHADFAIPLTGQPFHRWSVGLSENISVFPFLSNTGFPRIAVFANLTYLQQQFPFPPSAPTALKTERTWKPVYGVEVPISAIANAIGKAAKGGSSKSGSK